VEKSGEQLTNLQDIQLNFLEALGLSEEVVKPIIDQFVDNLKSELAESFRAELVKLKEEVKAEVKRELLQEAEQIAKQLGVNIQGMPAMRGQQQGGLDPNSPLWGLIHRLLGDDGWSQVMNKFMTMMVYRSFKKMILHDAFEDRIYRKFLGKEYDKIMKELEKALTEGEGETEGL
jgi:hypothetical protein